MFRKVIVGADGKEGGLDAAALASLLCDEHGELTLAHVYPGDPHAWRGSWPPLEPAEETRIREQLEKARTDAGLEAEIVWRGSSSVGRGLHEQAEAIGADLLVIGSSRRGLLGRALIGDDTRAALNGAPCAVGVAPAGYSRQSVVLREIGLGYDGSPESEHALRVARQLAAETGGKLSAFEVVSLPSYIYIGGPAGVAAESVRSAVNVARERIKSLGDVEAHAAYGQPAEELALYSASLDVLVIGSRSYGPIGRLVHGSVAQQLCRSARCPLLILTRAARKADAAVAAGNGRELAGAGGLT
jgi:nucleotide-binding universal stress UspA family protein